MKRFLLAIVPAPLLGQYRRLKRARASRRNASRSAEAVFSEIYENGRWGGGIGSSGSGTQDAHITDAYVEAVTREAGRHAFDAKTLVDIGCGDMKVGSRIMALGKSYIGADVVPALVEGHRTTFEGQGVSFVHLDAVNDQLPKGEICFIRQVLQHLSNDQITAILPKLAQYEIVYITEHLPTASPKVVPNRDKVHGSGIRLYEHSGVFLDQPPFNVDPGRLEVILEVPGHQLPGHDDPGVIRTTAYRPAPNPK